MSNTTTKTGFQIIANLALPGEAPELDLQPMVHDTYEGALAQAHFAQKGLRAAWGPLTIEFPVFIRDNATGKETEVPW